MGKKLKLFSDIWLKQKCLGYYFVWIYKKFLENCSFSNSLPQTWYPPSERNSVLEVNIVRLMSFCTKTSGTLAVHPLIASSNAQT